MYGKMILALALLAVGAQGLQLSDKAKEMVRQCRIEHNVPEDVIKNAFENKKLPETEPEKCFMECMMTKSGVIQDGKFNVERAQELALRRVRDDLKEQAKTIISDCRNIEKPAGKCEFGLKISQCVKDGLGRAGVTDVILME